MVHSFFPGEWRHYRTKRRRGASRDGVQAALLSWLAAGQARMRGGLAIEDWPSEFYGLGGDKLSPVPTGERLLEEFVKPMGLSQYRLAKEIGVPARPAPYTDP